MHSCRICSEYESFRSKALKVPDDSREMMELIAFMESARTELVRDLWENVQESLKRLSYLLDVHTFSPSEIDVNQTTLMWPSQLSPVFEQNEEVHEVLRHTLTCKCTCTVSYTHLTLPTIYSV